jgi:pentose-5-phosphate-3-epimerase
VAKVIPAILEHELSAYRKKVNLVRQLTDRFQLDVIDGELIDNKTIQQVKQDFSIVY